MGKERLGHDCKICLKPFTVFRWSTGPNSRFRRTEICFTCSKLKNLCQSCMFDLDFGLPAQIRDSILGIKDTVPQNEPNREYYLASNSMKLERSDNSLLDYGRASTIESSKKSLFDSLANLAKANRRDVNAANPCSFFAKGKCFRGDNCPFSHVLSAEKYPSLKSYRDRYYGNNDPAAEAILDNPEISHLLKRKHESSPKTIFIHCNRGTLNKVELTKYFEDSKLKPLSIKMILGNAAAFIDFPSKEEADSVFEKLNGSAFLNGLRAQISLVQHGKSSLAEPFKKKPPREE